MSHTSFEDLEKKITEARKKVEIGAIYIHYKTPEHKYIVEFVGLLEEKEEICVGYRALYGNGILWVRTIDNFTEEVDTETGKLKRFIKCDGEN
jgi:hypothetical protein